MHALTDKSMHSVLSHSVDTATCYSAWFSLDVNKDEIPSRERKYSSFLFKSKGCIASGMSVYFKIMADQAHKAVISYLILLPFYSLKYLQVNVYCCMENFISSLKNTETHRLKITTQMKTTTTKNNIKIMWNREINRIHIYARGLSWHKDNSKEPRTLALRSWSVTLSTVQQPKTNVISEQVPKSTHFCLEWIEETKI